MVSPLDYRLNIKDPFESLVQGYQFGTALRQQQEQQAQAQNEAALQAQMQQDIADAMADPLKMVALGVKYPILSEPVSRAWDMQTEGQRKETLNFGWAVNAALESGNVDSAQAMMQERATALRNAGDEQQAKGWDDAARIAKEFPEQAKAIVNLNLSQVDDKFAENYGKMKGLPAALRKGEAEATSAEAEASTAYESRLLDLERKGWDIKKIKSDMEINKRNSQIYALNARIAAERNEVEQQKLKIQRDELQRTRDQEISDRISSAETAQGAIADLNDATGALESHPGFSSLFGASMTPGARFVPGSDTAGAAAALEGLKAKAFGIGVEKMRGLGALGVLEGKRIEAALATLEPGMPEKDAKAALATIRASMKRMDEQMQKQYGVPAASTFALKKDATASDAEGDIEALVEKYLQPGQ